MKLIIAFLVSSLTVSCSSPYPGKQEIISIKGKWRTANINKPSESYITVDFADSTAIFDTLGDTILRFKYSIDQSSRTLWLTDPLRKRLSAKIINVDNDSLVFDRLWELSTIQHFYKKRNE
jgi:hypothetical protein